MNKYITEHKIDNGIPLNPEEKKECGIKRIVTKYQTGDKIPNEAVYLTSILQTEMLTNIGSNGDTSHSFWEKCSIEWHYFLEEVK